MVGAGRGDDAVPDHGLVGRVRLCMVGRRPLGGHIDKNLLGVPGKERGEVGVEREVDDGVFFLFAAVVVRSASDAVQEGSWLTRCLGALAGQKGSRLHLDTGCLKGSHNRRPFCDEVGGGDKGRDYKGDCCEETKHIL